MKGIYQSLKDSMLIVFVYDVADGDVVIYTEALHPVGIHCVSKEDFEKDFKKVHKITFAE